MADGSRHSIRMVEETVYGTTPTSPVFTTIRSSGSSIGLTKETLQSEEIRADRQISDLRHGTISVSDEISLPLSYGGAIDALLAAALCGTWEPNQPVTGTDRLKAGTTRRSYTIEQFFADIASGDKPYHRFTGVEVNSLKFSVAPKSLVTATVGVLGRAMSTGTAILSGATYPAATTTMEYDSFAGVVTEGGSTLGIVTEIQVSLENGLEARHVVGARTTLRPAIGLANVTGQLSAYFENSTLVEKFMNETTSSLQFTLVDPAGNELKWTLPKIKYTGGKPDVGGPGPIIISLPFQALFDTTAGTNLVVERKPV